ncbi:glycosyltransferase family 39 protein [Candidatus Sumerlaeota bacterium]|nr:glycosyltransferase family 39 protein [Candidatus Sumerlaeota bacterium]
MTAEEQSAAVGRKREQLLLAAIVFAAAVLRLVRLDLMPFEMDEGTACIFTVRFTHHGLPPLAGIKTSLQFYNSPLFLYVISPAFLVTTDPRFAVMLFGLLGTAAVYVVYRTGREFFSPAVGLLAAAMLALSPTGVEYSRRLWGHSLVQALSPIVFYLTLRWAVAGKAKAVFWLGLLIAAMQQFHFSASLLWVQVALAWLLFRPRTDWAGFACGVALGLIGYVPLLIHEADTGFNSLRLIWQALVGGAGEQGRFAMPPLCYWLKAPTDLGHCNFLQYRHAEFVGAIPFHSVTSAFAASAWCVGALACGASVLSDLGRARNEGLQSWARQRAIHILLVTWSFVPLIAFSLLRAPVVPPYFIIAYPAPFLIVAWAASEAWRKVGTSRAALAASRALRGAMVVLFVAWAVHQVAFQGKLLTWLDRNGGGIGSYASFGTQQEAMRFIANYAPGQTVIVSQEDNDPAKGIDSRYWYLLWTHDHEMQHFRPSDRENANYWFIIRNTHYVIVPEFESFLSAHPCRDFGFLRVYVIPRPGPWPSFSS